MSTKYPNDPVAQVYYERLLAEMAMYKGEIDSEHSLISSPENRKKFYDEMKLLPIHKDYGNGIVTHVNQQGNVTEYRTVDDHSRELIHFTDIRNQPANEEYDRPHTVQTAVERYKDSRLPKGFAENVLYDHFLKSKTPMRSDSTQYAGGVKLWNKLVPRVLRDGHHAYLYDKGIHYAITNENMPEMLSKYVGNRGSFQFKHLVISKDPL